MVLGGVRAPNFIFNLDIIYSGLKEIKLVLLKPFKNILRSYSNNISGVKGDKKLRFDHVVNMQFNEIL